MPNRLLLVLTIASLLAVVCPSAPADEADAARPADIGPFASVTTSYVSGHETTHGVNSGYAPRNSRDKSHGAYGNWPQTGQQWLEYQWPESISTQRVEVYWFDDARGVRLPRSARLLQWNGTAFVPASASPEIGLKANTWNVLTFPAVTTPRLRIEMEGNGQHSTGVLAWRVLYAGHASLPPRIGRLVDRTVVLGDETYLSPTVHSLAETKLAWAKSSGPGEVRFDHPDAAETAARFTAAGAYELKLTGNTGGKTSEGTVHVTVIPAPPKDHLTYVWPRRYTVTSRFWQPRLKVQITTWIPHCFEMLNNPACREGGIQNFIEAAKKLKGESAARHVGAPWANAYVLNTFESMCLAQMLDPAGDAELAAAQADLRKKIDQWLPLILAAQEPDGYLHTLTTLSGRPRWSNKGLHEGYTDGYFLDAAIAHFLMTGRSDRRMYDAARRMADCWFNHIGPAPKRSWYDGHEEIEQALLRFARLVDETDGPGAGRNYVALAKYLIDARGGGSTYDQSDRPIVRQYVAEGHAVRAAYIYNALAGIAMTTGQPPYYSAVHSIWDDLVNRKYYITGGVGSGDTSEGFGNDYHLGNNAYCEACADCGEVFFQHTMMLAEHQARYADLFEETLYNAVLGSMDLAGQNFTYTNPLDSSHARYRWHNCPCCVGNIPRTLLSLPTWTYATTPQDLYVNLFIGGSTNVGVIGGQSLQITQQTDYPWSGKVTLEVAPAAATSFALHIRVPNRRTSDLYTPTPATGGEVTFSVNGNNVSPAMHDGYAVISRTWMAGDRMTFELPLPVQRVTSDPRIQGNVGRVALRYGPLIYNLESVDNASLDAVLPADAPLAATFDPALLGGVMTITGRFQDGSPLKAIPNYARLNRGGRSIVWIRSSN